MVERLVFVEYTVIPAKEKGESARYPKPSIALYSYGLALGLKKHDLPNWMIP